MFTYGDPSKIEEKLIGYQPDIILLDINMPHRTGLEVLSSLKNDRRIKDIPVILMSANNDLKIIKEGLQQGAVDYITKPFSIGRIVSAVSQHLPKGRKKGGG